MEFTKHDKLVEKIVGEFLGDGFLVETEVELPNEKGAVDIVAKKGKLEIYVEVKSSPKTIDSGKVQKQLKKYIDYFGEGPLYCLISPNQNDRLKICSLDKTIHCSLKHYLSKI